MARAAVAEQPSGGGWVTLGSETAAKLASGDVRERTVIVRPPCRQYPQAILSALPIRRCTSTLRSRSGVCRASTPVGEPLSRQRLVGQTSRHGPSDREDTVHLRRVRTLKARHAPILFNTKWFMRRWLFAKATCRGQRGEDSQARQVTPRMSGAVAKGGRAAI